MDQSENNTSETSEVRESQRNQPQLRIVATAGGRQAAAAVGVHPGEAEVVVAGGDIQPGGPGLSRQLNQVLMEALGAGMHRQVGQVLAQAQQPQPRQQALPLGLTPQLRRQHRHHK